MVKIINIEGINYCVVDVYDLSITVPDSFVINDNKTCSGHGEAKLYMGSKNHMRQFYTNDFQNAGFTSKCFILKKDLVKYMTTTKHEYQFPSVKYRGQKNKPNMLTLWNNRMTQIQQLPNIMYFDIKDQNQIQGDRGYVKTMSNPMKGGYGIIRTIALPFVSYISVMKLRNVATNDIIFYWKLFTDFTRMAEQQYAAKNYGKRKTAALSRQRDGQDRYRQKLYSQFQYCPFTQIDDIKILVASHIKPWSHCNDSEKTDVDNGLMLSPLYDKLFDRGYITFDDNGDLIISHWLSPANQERIDFNYNVEDLHLTPKRKDFLNYHRERVFQA